VLQSSMVFLNDKSTLGEANPIKPKSLIHKMAGRSLIRDLEESRSEFHAKKRSYKDIRGEIGRLGILYQLTSSETSFLAIDYEGSVTFPEIAFAYGESGVRGDSFLYRGPFCAMEDHGKKKLIEMYKSFVFPCLSILLWCWM